MKTFLFAIILIFSSSLAFATPISGILRKGASSLYVILDGKSERYLLTTKSPETASALKKLTSGDLIVGDGNVDIENGTVELIALDYVGLKKLLGVWYNSKSVMNFKNYTDLSVYPVSKILDARRPSGVSLPSTDIRYSMAPYQGNQWAIFLSNSTATIFATIEVFRDKAKLFIYDNQTGQPTDTIILTRWRK